MTDLRLSADLKLPVAVVTEPVGIFANRGKGKSNAAHLLVEQLYHAGQPAIVLDVKGDWYGIRSSANGRSEGLPFLILGGEHADVPLEDGSGRLVAQLLAEQRVPSVIDLSGMSKTKARQWVMEFAETLYRTNREPLMLVVDEADVLIPQRLSAEMMRLLGAMEDIAKRGRQRGLGICVISQRVADVNKSVTDLLETLFLFAVTGTRTRKALLEWIDDHADPQQAKDVIATLSSLPPGECWVWSPGWLHMLHRTRLDRISTFDSHATPEPGKARTEPKTYADLDLAAVKEAMADTIEKVKADDPRELRKQLAKLGTELAKLRAETDAHTCQSQPVEIPVLTDDDRGLIEQFIQRWDDAYDHSTEIVNTLRDALDRAQNRPAPAAQPAAPRATTRSLSSKPHPAVEVASAPAERREPSEGITRPQQRILDALAWLAAVGIEPASRVQVGMIAGYHPRTKGFTNGLGALSSGGYVTYPLPGYVVLTDAGQDTAQPPDVAPTTEHLQQMIYAQVGNARARILREVIAVYPDEIARTELAARLGYHERTKGFTNGLGSLRTLGLIDYPAPGLVVATDLLFLDQ